MKIISPVERENRRRKEYAQQMTTDRMIPPPNKIQKRFSASIDDSNSENTSTLKKVRDRVKTIVSLLSNHDR